MLDHTPLPGVSAFVGLAVPTPLDGRAGITVMERRNLGIATLAARRGASEAVAARMDAAFAIALIDGPKTSAAAGGGPACFGIGPGRWLAVQPGGGWRFARDMAAKLEGAASVCDQSSGYGVLRLTGPAARDVLAKGVPVDLHPAAFQPGDVAVTLAGHIAIVLWQVDDAPTFDIAVPRSYAGDAWAWLTASAAEFGLGVASPID